MFMLRKPKKRNQVVLRQRRTVHAGRDSADGGFLAGEHLMASAGLFWAREPIDQIFQRS
jgi:hypothetical protein